MRKLIFRNYHAVKNQNGLTLVEVAIFLVVAGLILLPILEALKVEKIRDKVLYTKGSLAEITSAINIFYSTGNLRYPCPASVIAGQGAANLGEEGDCTPANLKLCTDPTWRTTTGLCTTNYTNTGVVFGGVPFKVLKLDQNVSVDSWGNKILYAVTYEQVVAATFTGNNGALQILSTDSPLEVAADGVPDPETNFADFILFSTGDNGRGGFSKNGNVLGACGTYNVDGYDNENCDLDNVFFNEREIGSTLSGAYSVIAGPTYFDDWTRYQESVPEAIWFMHPLYNDFTVTLYSRVGVGEMPQGPSNSLEVAGNIVLRPETVAATPKTGNAKSNNFCNINGVPGNYDGIHCMQPEKIVDAEQDMSCDYLADASVQDIYPVKRIRFNRTICAKANSVLVTPANENLSINGLHPGDSCPTGDRVVGFDASGYVICATP